MLRLGEGANSFLIFILYHVLFPGGCGGGGGGRERKQLIYL